MTQVVYFAGYDTGSHGDLWETNGTASGTFPVGGLGDAGVQGVSGGGLSPQDITAFGNEVLFNGTDAAITLGFGLWVSNGAASGTYEVGGLNDAGVAGAGSSGLNPTGLLTFGSKALFFGNDSSGSSGLWVTDGTAAGTTEIGGLGNAGISGKYFAGWSPTSFTAVGGEVFFNARDTNGYQGLWVTNGTATGTYEIGGLDNAGIAGVSVPSSGGFGVNHMFAFNGKLLFLAVSSTNSNRLWVSDGTAAGTTQIASAGPANGTSFAALGDELFFQAGNSSLWVTNGTTSGTTEIGGANNAGIAGAGYSLLGSPVQIAPRDFAVLGNKMFFTALDSTQNYGLWISDGTAAGTTEIGGLGDAGVSGKNLNGFSVLADASIGAKVLFTSRDPSGAPGLWVTDGTASGTFELGGTNNAGVAGAPAGGLNPSSFTVIGNEAYFTAPNSSTLWVSNGTVAGTYQITSAAGPYSFPNYITAVTTQGTAPDNFTGSNISDLLLENASGAVVVGAVQHGAESYTQVAALGPEWSFKRNGDFLGDGNTDFLIENTSGAVAVGEVSNGTTNYTQVAALGSEWKFVGSGDFLGNGQDQFLIENTSGAVATGNVAAGQAQYAQVAALGSEWSFKETGNFLGDGKTGFLIENTSGAIAVGEVSNGTTNYTQVAALGAEWKFVGSGDFLGNGHDQFLIENSAGAIDVANVVNGQAQYTSIAALGPEWSFIGTGDYLGTGTAGFMIENAAGAIVLGTIANGQASYAQVGALGKEWASHS